MSNVKILEHGSKFDKKTEYKFQLCPECLSEKVIAFDSYVPNHHRTGHKQKKRIGIFDVELVHVNYKCNDCGCVFYDEYEVEGSRKIMNVNEAIAKRIILIIALSFLILSDCILFDTLFDANPDAIGVFLFILSACSTIVVAVCLLFNLIEY